MRHALCGVTIQEHLLNVFQTIDEAFLQSFGLGNVLVHFQTGNAESFTHAHTLVCGQSARAHTALVTATVHLGFEANTGFAAHIQSTNAFGAVGFVGGQTHQVDRQGVEVDGQFACGLGCVDVEDDALLAANGANGGDVLNHANFVVHKHDTDQDGVMAQCRLEHIQVDQTVFLHVKVSDFKALALKFAHGVEHGFVFCLHSNEVLAARFVKLGGALQSQVVGFGGTAGPYNFAGVCTDEVGHVFAGFFHGFFGFPAPGMAA